MCYSKPAMELFSEHSTVVYRHHHVMNEPVPTLMPAPTFYHPGPSLQIPPQCIYPVYQPCSPYAYYLPQGYATVEVNASVTAVGNAPSSEYHRVQERCENHDWTSVTASVAHTAITIKLLHCSERMCEKQQHHHHTEAHSNLKRHTRRQSHDTDQGPSDTAKAQRDSKRRSSHPHRDDRHEKERDSRSSKLPSSKLEDRSEYKNAVVKKAKKE